ncbi:hypothetical protein OCU04_012425 [Sclerotinia nivalis]|uniref:Uncharacterized protein n=1 Tax=Sclerotinia nivalis TaxID=352851 RepID=A0A9X0A8K3_9HELO|nr:hypothetical protein OCU04_012425 [Sclerotinia nivalis]
MLSQHPAFVMADVSTPSTFLTFHSNTTAIPTETTTQVLGYIVADARPLGGGVDPCHTPHTTQ